MKTGYPTQHMLFNIAKDSAYSGVRRYGDILTVAVNRKGVVDVDTVKGCTFGMLAYPNGGCYGECYANKIAQRNGIDFTTSVVRTFADVIQHRDVLIKALLDHAKDFYRVGVMGDPSHNWNNTLNVIRLLGPANKVAVIVTKHWIPLSDDHISRLLDLRVVVHTSTSGLDTDEEIHHRVKQLERLRHYGVPSINRVVTCKFGTSAWAVESNTKQQYLLSLTPIIDNPLRASRTNPRIQSGDVLVTRRGDSIGGGRLVSTHSTRVFLGHCETCPDQCGVYMAKETTIVKTQKAIQTLFEIDRPRPEVTWKYVQSVIGSGFEADVAALALEDGIAHRAARKNMQIHSAIILLIGGEFAGFFTFQNNHTIEEFCLLQSVIKPEHFSQELYRAMAVEVVKCNTSGYPMLMTTNPKSKFETPKLFKSLGFETYLAMSGFEYMLSGDPSYARMKTLAHITMTNVWDSVRDKWVKLKKEWNAHIAQAGEKHNVNNPTFATREGAWQGENGFANVVTGRSHNGNASVLDPVACEVILRFFSPKTKGRVYNPFGGGVQFGFVSGASGYSYLASEIRQNQCDANNLLCSEFADVRWIKEDSSKYEPEGLFDLIFTCPPYFKVEKYLDYDGLPPDGELNAMSSYVQFRDTLFAGYRIALDHLSDNRFFVVMTGDSRDAKGAYHCHEAETELWMKENGLSVYNKIVYLECEFTRLAHAKKTLNTRKFPKREQKIIVGYKGDIDAIQSEFPNIGRL